MRDIQNGCAVLVVEASQQIDDLGLRHWIECTVIGPVIFEPVGMLSSAESETRFCIKKKRFSMEQIVAVLKQTELGVPVAR
jgi:hypothetical protein